jgi:hypothetical protein
VSLQMEDIGLEEIIEDAQLWLLFKASFLELTSRKMVHKELTFVELYKEISSNKLNRLLKCVEIGWANVNT